MIITLAEQIPLQQRKNMWLLFFVIVIIGIISFIYFNNFRKETCINKGGQVIENVIGVYDKCIYGVDKE